MVGEAKEQNNEYEFCEAGEQMFDVLRRGSALKSGCHKLFYRYKFCIMNNIKF